MAGHPAPAPAGLKPPGAHAARGGRTGPGGRRTVGVGVPAVQPPRAGRDPLVGAQVPPAEGERFLLQVLAQQAGVALANARLHSRERNRPKNWA